MKHRSRRLLATIVTVLASATLLLTVLANYAKEADAAGFAGRAVSVVQAGPIQSLIVDDLTGRLVTVVGGQSHVRPIVAEAVQAALSNAQVTAEIRAEAGSLQSQLLSSHATSLTLALPAIGPAIAASIGARSPELAAVVERLGTITVVDVRIPPSAAQAVNDLAYLGRDATLLIILTVALATLALLLAPDRRRTLIGLGIGTCISGLLAVAAYLGGRELIAGQFPSHDGHTAARTVWSIYLSGLETLGLVLAGAGAVLAAIAALMRAGSSAPVNARGWSSV